MIHDYDELGTVYDRAINALDALGIRGIIALGFGQDFDADSCAWTTRAHVQVAEEDWPQGLAADEETAPIESGEYHRYARIAEAVTLTAVCRARLAEVA